MKETAVRYSSTNLIAPEVSFSEALLKGLAPDGGLYMPSYLPALDTADLESIHGMSYPELAFSILGKLIGNEISRIDLESICKSVYNFRVPLEPVSKSSYILRLDQGPTASFKDFAALLMGRLMQYFLAEKERQITILTATSGDTGSAVANAFSGLENIRVIILYPAGEVSTIQRKQMTTFHGNIKVIEIGGKFDDCQRLVKTAFMDRSLERLNLSSANSINVGRLLPQSIYYFKAWSELADNHKEKIAFSVPSGNFGNLAGGLIARRMGLPVSRFIIATNENDEVPVFLATGSYRPLVPSKNCLSSAMNVGHPSNLARITAMYGGIMDEKGNFVRKPDIGRMRSDLFAVSISDSDTKVIMKNFHSEYGSFLEPHGAVAWAGLQRYLETESRQKDKGSYFVSLETAHPGKFRDEILSVTGIDPGLPESIRISESKKEDYISLENDYSLLKDLLLRNY